MDETSTIRYTGMDLKLQRVAADVRQIDLAEAIGCHPSRIVYLEGRRIVTPKAAAEYMAALRTLTTNPTEGAA